MENRKNIETSIKPDNIPLDSSLGLLAIGDLAFEAWRERKKKNNKETDKNA